LFRAGIFLRDAGEGDAGDRDVLVRFRGMRYRKGDIRPNVVDFIVREPSNSRAKFTRISINLFYILTFLLYSKSKNRRAFSSSNNDKRKADLSLLLPALSTNLQLSSKHRKMTSISMTSRKRLRNSPRRMKGFA